MTTPERTTQRVWPPTHDSLQWEHLRSLPQKDSAFPQANQFMDSYYEQHPEAKDDLSVAWLFRDIKDGRFWGIMDRIDGQVSYEGIPTFANGLPKSEWDQEREKSRTWAKENFTEEQLQDLFGIYMEMVFSAPEGTVFAPGSQRPFSIAHSQIVEKPGSMFADRISPQLRRRLNNGRFWEELADMRVGINGGHSFRVVDNVLTKNYKDLDPTGTADGLKVLERVNGEGRKFDFDLRYLSDEALDRYADFVGRINTDRQALGVSKQDIAKLVRPYFDEVIGPDFTDEESLRFDEHYDYDKNRNVKPKKDYKARLQDPIIQEYLPMFLDKELVSHLEYLASIGQIEAVTEVLKAIPSPNRITETAEAMKSEPIKRLAILYTRVHSEDPEE